MSLSSKENIIVAASCFGLGPVGKLAAIVNRSVDYYNWFAVGEHFDTSIFHDNVFADVCWSMDRDVIKKFIYKNNIRLGLVVLKNRIAHLLTGLGVKVIYIDSLPFMWTKKDANEGKIPYDVYCYCAQKTLSLNEESKKLFDRVQNLHWIEPIVNLHPANVKPGKHVMINLGGFSSPHGINLGYLELIILPLIDVLKQDYEEIIVTCGKKAQEIIKQYLQDTVLITTYAQTDFLEMMYSSEQFISSPGLTTIVEMLQYDKPIVILPPQNLSQFYNILFAKKALPKYKIIEWLTSDLSPERFTSLSNLEEGEIVKKIYETIQIQNTQSNQICYRNYIHGIINRDYIQNKIFKASKINGVNQVLDIIHDISQGGC